MLERDYLTAEKIWTDFPLQTFPRAGAALKSLYQGRVALARGDTASAQRYFTGARPDLEAWVRARPEEASRHASLGMLYAYQGRKKDALREGLRAGCTRAGKSKCVSRRDRRRKSSGDLCARR